MDLRANTAVDVLIGPFVDSTDGNTEETGLTIARADVKLSKNGQALTQKNDDTTAVHDANGYYNCELDTTDTNTEGNLVLIVHVAGALSVRHEFNVMAEAAWDSLYVAKDDGFMDVNIKAISDDTTAADNLESYTDGTTPIPANTTQLSGDATAADNAESFFDGTGYAGTNNVIPTVTTVTNIHASTARATAVSDVYGTITNGTYGLSALETLVDGLETDVTFIKDVVGGGWEITGNQLICYKSDNTTEVARFNLTKAGVANMTAPDKKFRT